MADIESEAVEIRPQTHERLLIFSQRCSDLEEFFLDTPIHKNTASPYLLSQIGILSAQLSCTGPNSIKSEALSHSNRQPHDHPCTMGVIGTLQVATYEQQALDNIQSSWFPDDTIGPQKSPGAVEVGLTCVLPKLGSETFLELGGKSEYCMQRAQKYSLVCFGEIPGEVRIIGPKKCFLADERFQWVDVLEINSNQMIGIFSQRQKAVYILGNLICTWVAECRSKK